MTSAISGSSTAYQLSSPLDRLKTTLQSQVSSGTVTSSDQSALSSALDSIDASIRSSRGSQSAKETGDPKSKIDALIDAQVSAGSLTSDQAEELRGVFSAAFGSGPQGAGGMPPGPPPGPPPMGGDDEDEDSTTSASSTQSGGVDIAALLQELMKKVSETQASYTGSGTNTATGTAASLFFDKAV
jgi:flagellar hook-basal body complex protein FliE